MKTVKGKRFAGALDLAVPRSAPMNSGAAEADAVVELDGVFPAAARGTAVLRVVAPGADAVDAGSARLTQSRRM